MKSKNKSKREFVFTSSFALRDCSSRLRNLVQKHRWEIELEPVDSETYAFHISTERWIPFSISGSLQRDDRGTLIQGTGEVNWLLVAGMVAAGLVLIPFQWTQVLVLVDTMQRVLSNLDIADLGSWLNLIFISVILLAQVALAAAFYLTARKALKSPRASIQILEKTLTDMITDLPQANSISDEDGELVPIHELLVSEDNASNSLRQ